MFGQLASGEDAKPHIVPAINSPDIVCQEQNTGDSLSISSTDGSIQAIIPDSLLLDSPEGAFGEGFKEDLVEVLDAYVLYRALMKDYGGLIGGMEFDPWRMRGYSIRMLKEMQANMTGDTFAKNAEEFKSIGDKTKISQAIVGDCAYVQMESEYFPGFKILVKDADIDTSYEFQREDYGYSATSMLGMISDLVRIEKLFPGTTKYVIRDTKEFMDTVDLAVLKTDLEEEKRKRILDGQRAAIMRRLLALQRKA